MPRKILISFVFNGVDSSFRPMRIVATMAKQIQYEVWFISNYLVADHDVDEDEDKGDNPRLWMEFNLKRCFSNLFKSGSLSNCQYSPSRWTCRLQRRNSSTWRRIPSSGTIKHFLIDSSPLTPRTAPAVSTSCAFRKQTTTFIGVGSASTRSKWFWLPSTSLFSWPES